MVEVTECRYRGRIIGHLVRKVDGFLAYVKKPYLSPDKCYYLSQTELRWVEIHS